MTDYYTAAELDTMGATLQRDIDLCSDDLRRWFNNPRTQAIRTYAEPGPERPKPPPQPRAYASIYVGVARIKGRYVGDKQRRRGERDAACDRAGKLGLPYLERRDCTQEAL